MISINEYPPVLIKLVGGKFDGEVFWHEEQIESTTRFDSERVGWVSFYRNKESDGEECEGGMHVLHFDEEIHVDDMLRILRETNPPCFCESGKNWLECCFSRFWSN